MSRLRVFIRVLKGLCGQPHSPFLSFSRTFPASPLRSIPTYVVYSVPIYHIGYCYYLYMIHAWYHIAASINSRTSVGEGTHACGDPKTDGKFPVLGSSKQENRRFLIRFHRPIRHPACGHVRNGWRTG